MADPDQTFGEQSNRRASKSLHSFPCSNTPSSLWQSLGITQKWLHLERQSVFLVKTMPYSRESPQLTFKSSKIITVNLGSSGRFYRRFYPVWAKIRIIQRWLFLASSPRPAMSNPRAAYGPVEVLCGPVQVFAVVKVSCILTTCPCFDNFKFDIFDAGGPQASLSRLLPLP